MNLNLKQMNTINFKTFAAGLLVCLAMVACVQDDDFSVPSSVGSEENERLELDVISETEKTKDIPSFFIGETISNELIINKKKSLPNSSQKIKTKIILYKLKSYLNSK